MIRIVGNDDGAEFARKVADALKPDVCAACMVNADMYFSGMADRIDSELVVFVMGVASHRELHPAFMHEQGLLNLLARSSTPCIVVYKDRHYAPAHLQNDVILNVVVSYVPEAPTGNPVNGSGFRPQRMEHLPRDTDRAAHIVANKVRDFLAAHPSTQIL